MKINLTVVGIMLFIIATIMSFVGPFLNASNQKVIFVSTIIHIAVGWILVLIDRLRR